MLSLLLGILRDPRGGQEGGGSPGRAPDGNGPADSPQNRRGATVRLRGRGLLSLAILGTAAVGSGETRADRVLLRNGGVLLADHWWIDGDTLFYESPGGSVGVPRSLVAEVTPSLEAAGSDPAAGGRPIPMVPPRPDPSPLPATAPVQARDWVDEGMAAFSRRDFDSSASSFE